MKGEIRFALVFVSILAGVIPSHLEGQRHLKKVLENCRIQVMKRMHGKSYFTYIQIFVICKFRTEFSKEEMCFRRQERKFCTGYLSLSTCTAMCKLEQGAGRAPLGFASIILVLVFSQSLFLEAFLNFLSVFGFPVVFSFVKGWVEQFYRHDKESSSQA